MEKIKYRYNGEYAVKYESLIYKNKDSVELFDCVNWEFVDTKNMTVEWLADLVAEIGWTGRDITEEEYNEIINKEKKED